jgi:hypothetical protein
MESWFYLAMFAMNMQPAFLFWKPTLKTQSLELTGKKLRTAKNVAFIVTWSLPWCFHGIFELMQIGPLELASEVGGERVIQQAPSCNSGELYFIKETGMLTSRRKTR